jgi:hypothetical protein
MTYAYVKCFLPAQWLFDALEEWKRYYYNNRVEGPLLQAGRALYHLGHIALAIQVRLLYAAAGSE